MKNQKRINDLVQTALMAALLAAALPHPAFAQDLANTVSILTGKELTGIPDLIGAVYYIGGAAFTGAGLLKIKQHSDNPTQVKLGEGVGRLSVGAGLMALPFFANATVQTFGFGTSAAPYARFNSIQ